MKIALIGVTGFVGSAILKEALDRSHEVTAIVQHPEKLQPHPKLHPQTGDIYNADEVVRGKALLLPRQMSFSFCDANKRSNGHA